MEQQRVGLGQRWRELQLTKTAVFWSCVASAIVTMVIGFSWGGWVTGSTARSMAELTGDSAVVKRLAPICLVRFEQDPDKAQKLKVVKGTDTWQRGEYVKKQGWATMPGEREADGKVADECVKLLMLSRQ
jgi:alpha/beta superfamily hydrolase